MRQAFEEAREGKPVVLAVTNHDFRDMRPDVDDGAGPARSRWRADFPEVPSGSPRRWQAMREALGLPAQPPCELDLRFEAVGDGTHVLRVASPAADLRAAALAGPEDAWPARYHHDNFDIDVPFHRWQYVFDEETFPLRALETRRRRRQQCVRE